MTPEERALIGNGCGPKGLFIKVPDFIFTASCCRHDVNYWIGCTKKDRKRADKGFYRAMKADYMAYTKFLTRRRYALWAWIYYRAVRMFGGRYFYFAKKQRTWDDLDQAMNKNHAAS